MTSITMFPLFYYIKQVDSKLPFRSVQLLITECVKNIRVTLSIF